MIGWPVNNDQHWGLPSLQYSEYQGWFFLFMMCFIKIAYICFCTTVYADRMIMTVLSNSCVFFIMFKTCAHILHNNSLFVLGGRGSVHQCVWDSGFLQWWQLCCGLLGCDTVWKVVTKVTGEHTVCCLDHRFSVLLQCISTHLSDYIVP